MLQTRLTEKLGCQYPIVQTAMGWVADPKLVAGSCNAGGFGFLAGATIPPQEIERDILRVKELTAAPFGVNFHMYQPNAADIVDMVIRHGVRAVSYSRSPGPEMIRKLKDAGVICMPTVGLPKHAIKAVELGADVVTVQGGEGGGHTGAVPTTLLIPQVVDAVGDEGAGGGRGRFQGWPRPGCRAGLGRRRHRHGYPLPDDRREPGAPGDPAALRRLRQPGPDYRVPRDGRAAPADDHE